VRRADRSHVVDSVRLWVSQVGLVAEASLTVVTRRQSTSEYHAVSVVEPGFRWWLALWKLHREIRREIAELRRLPGEHDYTGSDYRQGIPL
jgi:hypothetical protein